MAWIHSLCLTNLMASSMVWISSGWHHENSMGLSPNHWCDFFLFFKCFLLLSALSCLMSYLSTIPIRHGFLSLNNFLLPLFMLLLGKHRFFRWCTTLGSKIGNIFCGYSNPTSYLTFKIFHPNFFFDQSPYHGVVEGLFNTKNIPPRQLKWSVTCWQLTQNLGHDNVTNESIISKIGELIFGFFNLCQ